MYLKTIVEPVFDIVKGTRGEILLMISSKPGKVDDPVLDIYPKKGESVLHRSASSQVLLTKFHPGALEMLLQAQQVIVGEMGEKELTSEYVIPVKVHAEK